jgi:gliding motility-associated-like protein
MIRKSILGLVLGLLLLLAGATPSFAQITNRGKDFWVGYGHHQFMETNRSMDMVLYLSAEDTATVTVTIYGSGGGIGPSTSPEWKRVYKMNKNTVISTGTTDANDWQPKTGPNAIPSKGPMPKGLAASGWDAFYNCTLYDSWGAEPPANSPTPFRKKAIHITSTADVVAYAHIYGSASSGATMLFPTKAWGYNYTAINNKQQYAANCYGWMYIIADHDNTYVEITPSQNTKGGRAAGVPFFITLNRGEIYQIAGVTSGSTGVELTGTRVRSLAKPGTNECYPVAVFCGSSRTSNPANCGSGGGDNDNQQMFPQEAWGKRYQLAPLSSSTNVSNLQINMYKIVTNDPTTVVRRKIGAGALNVLNPVTTNANGKIYYFESNTPDYIESDKPIMVAQFMSGGSACLAGGQGDPEMIYLSPIEQAINRIGFYRNTYENITTNFLTMVIPTAGISSLRIDNTPFASIPAGEKYSAPLVALPGYSMVAKRWAVTAKGPGAQCIVTSDSFFNAVTYGLGSVESYGYNAGTNLNNLNIKPSLRNVLDTSQNKEHPFTCTETTFELSIYSAYKPYKIDWLLSKVPYISPNADVSLGNLSAALVPIDTQYFDGIAYYKYRAPGGPYKFSQTGIHNIQVRLYNPLIENCYSREDLEISIEVKNKPAAGKFTATTTGCPADSVRFTGQNNDPDFLIAQWKWKFPGGLTAEGVNAAAILPVGDNTIQVQTITKEGCVNDTSQLVNIPPGATADYTVDKQKVCEGEEVTFTPAPSLSAGSYFWDFGDGTKDTLTTNTAVKHLYKKYDTVLTSLTLSANGNCKPISTKEIIVRAKPVLSVSYPAGCLPIDGVVQFTSNSTVADGQILGTYLWNFGDANATPGNPNTSAAPNPFHTYQYGTYNISYAAVTNEGCSRDTVINATFNIKPDLAFPALPEVCENETTVSVAKASVKNNVPGTGTYKGPGVSGVGDFNPKIAGQGVHTIWWVYAATSGCVDSISQTVRVNAAPQPGFTHPTGCLPSTNMAQFTNKTIIADGQSLTWSWDFGDQLANAGNPNTSTAQSPTHIYSAHGTYGVKLVATSAKGCKADTTIQVSLAIQPKLAFASLADACENAVNLTVAKASVTNGATGTGRYEGPGTDATGNFNPTAAGLGDHDIMYYFEATGGCIDSVSQKIAVNAAPVARFAFPQGCLPANNTVLFTNESSIADAQTLAYSWFFDDANATPANPNTSTQLNPTHIYSTEGVYNVKLSVTSQRGCLDDTSMRASLAVRPTLAFAAIGPVCENATNVSVAKASVTNGVSGSGRYFGPGTDNAGNFNPLSAGIGAHTIKYYFETTGGCIDSTSQTVNVYASPVPGFSFPQGCLPVNNRVQFTNTTSIADAQTLSWSWNFDDPNANASNPNTSTLQNPTHIYNNEGQFDVTLIVTSQRGCIADTTIRASLAVRPALQYPSLSAVCANDAPLSVAQGSISNGVTGSAIYKGPGTSSSGQFNPKTAGPGMHTIWYVFTSNGGCTDSLSQTIQVKAVPVAAFTATPGICLDALATITDGSTLAGGNITSWNWSYGDGTAEVRNTGASFTKGYTNAGNYTIRLYVNGSNGCRSDTVGANTIVHALPSAGFNKPSFVCMPQGRAAFTNTSTIQGGGALAYSWNFGDNGTSTATNPLHIYQAGAVYEISLTATSSFGCVGVHTDTLRQFYDQPIADFTATPSELCQGTASVFTDNSTAPNSSITKWFWSFGDGSSSGSGSVDKTYTSAGNYMVKLVVSNAVGCVSDTAVSPVTVYLQPVVDAGKGFIAKPGKLVQFAASANSPSLSFQWTPATGLNNPNILNPTLTVSGDQTYTLIATGDNGCTASDTLRVTIQGNVTVPNAFSPNGDGINDVWLLRYIDTYPQADIKVFDRYGKIVYRGTHSSRPWDGTNQGKPLPVGVYYYVVNLKDNESAPLTGSITLIR